MYKLGKYKGSDKMSDLIADNYPMLLVVSRFGIPLGFGEKNISEVCSENGVDDKTFLTVVNMQAEEHLVVEDIDQSISLPLLISYLHNAHDYFLEYRLPLIRRKLVDAIGGAKDVSVVIIRYFDEYVHAVRRHMMYEEETVFPYVRALLEGRAAQGYSIDVFRRKHDHVEVPLAELKNIIIKYYSGSTTNELVNALFDIFSTERDLASHNNIEDNLFVPAIAALESRRRDGK